MKPIVGQSQKLNVEVESGKLNVEVTKVGDGTELVVAATFRKV